MLNRKSVVLKTALRPLSVKFLQLNKVIFGFFNKTIKEVVALFLVIKNHRSDRVKIFAKLPALALVLALYLFISPHSAVKAIFEEKVIPDQTQKVVKISSLIISEKALSFLAPIHGYISTKFSHFHPGIDIPNPTGSPIKSACDGEVVFTGFVTSGHGNLVIIKHNLGFESFYAHLSKIRVKPGQTVIKGQEIGTVGSTGNSTGSHLHFEIHQNGAPKNPLKYITP